MTVAGSGRAPGQKPPMPPSECHWCGAARRSPCAAAAAPPAALRSAGHPAGRGWPRPDGSSCAMPRGARPAHGPGARSAGGAARSATAAPLAPATPPGTCVVPPSKLPPLVPVDQVQKPPRKRGKLRVLLVGDSKLISRGNIVAMNKAQVGFIAPASKPYLPAGVLGGLDVQQASPVDYVASRDAGKPPIQRGAYRVLEGTVTLAGKPARKRSRRPATPDLAVRCVFVWSSARAQAAATSRAKKLDRAGGDLERLQRGLGGRYYRTAEQVGQASCRERVW